MLKRRQNLINYFSGITECVIQHREGWYYDDCLTRKVPKNKRCYRCHMLAKLIAELEQPPAS